jgi:serine/threonine protein kinase
MVQREEHYSPGDRIGDRYLVQRVLHGDVTEVYLCIDLERRAPVTLKTFAARYGDEQLRAAFFTASQQWLGLERHANLVRYLRLEFIDDKPFLILEPIEASAAPGPDLRGILRRSLELNRVLNLGIGILQGLINIAVHQPHAVHGNLKPETILVTNQTAKITGFEAVEMVQASGLVIDDIGGQSSGRYLLQSVAGVVGTPAYMAPEQWRAAAVDARADLYAVGGIVYEMLTGHQPFAGHTRAQLRQQHLAAPVPRLDPRHPLAPSFNAWLARTLAKQPDERFQSIQEAQDQLQRIRDQYVEVTSGLTSLPKSIVGGIGTVRAPSPAPTASPEQTILPTEAEPFSQPDSPDLGLVSGAENVAEGQAGTPAPTDAQRLERQVRVGIVAIDPPQQATDADVLAPTQPLAPNTDYYVRIDISGETTATNVTNPMPIEPQVLARIPEGAELTVAVFSEHFRIPQEGPFAYLQPLHLLPGYASTFVYVRITTPKRPRLGRLSICIFYKNTLLQWLIMDARVGPISAPVDTIRMLRSATAHRDDLTRAGMTLLADVAALSEPQVNDLARRLNVSPAKVQEWRSEAQRLLRVGNESTIVYTISPTFAGFEALEAPSVSIIYETNGVVRAMGPEGSLPTSHVMSGLRTSLTSFRNLMTSISEPRSGEYFFVPNNTGAMTSIPGQLLRMADQGRSVFNAVFNNSRTRQELRDCLLQPSMVEISRSSSEELVPWAGLYDLPLLDEYTANLQGTPRATCMRWAERDHQQQTVGPDGVSTWSLDFNTCFNAAGCPRKLHAAESDDALQSWLETNVCVYGFWGFKHRLQQPLNSAADQSNRVMLPLFIPVEARPAVNVIANTKLMSPDHERNLSALTHGPLHPIVRSATTLTDVKAVLQDTEVHVVYFLCHGDTTGQLPMLLVGNDDIRISLDILATWNIWWPVAPIVIVNGCSTATYNAEALTSLILDFRGLNAAGVIGTEIPVFTVLATWFGEQFMQRFLSHRSVGDIILELRLELLKKWNPLGLMYTNYSLAGLHLQTLASVRAGE